jgi:Transglutaminase-like superfamily
VASDEWLVIRPGKGRMKMLNLETRAPMAAMSMSIPEGDPGTAATIAQMRRLIDEGAKDPVVHELAARLVSKLRPYDWNGEAQAIYNWVRANVRFTRDVRGKETLHAAREIIRLGIGDCDDFTILICALAASVGFKCRIVTVSADPRAPEIFSHVYPELAVGGRWIALDAARRNPAFGRTPARFFRKRAWDAGSPDYSDISGMPAGMSGLGVMMPTPVRVRAAQMTSAPPPLPRDNRLLRRRMRARRSLYGLGIDAGDWQSIIGAASSGASQIIQAARATPYNIFPGSQQPYFQQQPGYGASGGGSFQVGTPTLVLLGIGFAVALAMGRR